MPDQEKTELGTGIHSAIILSSLLALMSSAATSAQDHFEGFEDYDYSRWSQEITECDRQASHGRDPGHVGPPLTSDTMDKSAAIEACLAAVAADPENPRLNYQLGRAYGYSGMGDKAMPYRLKAVEAGYPQSLFVIGYLYINGMTIEQDICRAMELWRQGAHYRRIAALVALPRHYMMGDFSSCGVEISTHQLKAYLQEAKKLTSDYYQTMLIEDLLVEVDRLH